MATIVHVGNFPFGLRPGFQHGVAVKLSNGMIRNGHLVLSFSDRDIARAKSFLGHRTFGRSGANGALEAFCRLHRPDVLLLGHADIIDSTTVHSIRAHLPRLKVAQWSVDTLSNPDNVRRLRAKIPHMDVTFVSTAGAPLQALGAAKYRVAFLPNPVDLSIERGMNHLAVQLDYDVLYACGNPARPPRLICGQEWNMDDFVRKLLSELPHVRPLLGGLLGRPHLTGAAYQSSLESAALGLNISCRPDHFLYSSDRIAQLVGNGVAVLIERATGYDKIFTDKEMVFFSSFDELVDQIDRLVKDPARRQAIAAAGRKRYIELFNERAVAAYLLDVIFERTAPDDIIKRSMLVGFPEVSITV
jgi:glycosyl transferase family 1